MIRLAVALAAAVACSSPAPKPAPDRPPEPPEAAEPPAANDPAAPATTEVVKLPWEGEVLEREDFCMPEREPALDTTTNVFSRVEIRAAGLELIERATYRSGDAVSVELHGSGCTHDTMTMTFVVRDATPPTDVAHYRAVAAKLLSALPIRGEPPNYATVTANVLETGKPHPDTPNLMLHGGEATITFDVEAAGEAGAVKLVAAFDFAI